MAATPRSLGFRTRLASTVCCAPARSTFGAGRTTAETAAGCIAPRARLIAWRCGPPHLHPAALPRSAHPLSHTWQAPGPNGPLHLTALRLCDTCAFSPSHPEHLGCVAPCACPRCSRPRSLGQLIYLAKAALWDLICFPFCCAGWVCIARACAASTDSRLNQQLKSANRLKKQPRTQPSDLKSDPAPQPPDARPLPVRYSAPPRNVPSKSGGFQVVHELPGGPPGE